MVDNKHISDYFCPVNPPHPETYHPRKRPKPKIVCPHCGGPAERAEYRVLRPGDDRSDTRLVVQNICMKRSDPCPPVNISNVKAEEQIEL